MFKISFLLNRILSRYQRTPKVTGTIIRMAVVSEKNLVVAGFRIEFGVPPGSESDAAPTFTPGFMTLYEAKNLICRDTRLIKPEERIKSRKGGCGRGGKFLCPVIYTSAADDVCIHGAMWHHVNDRDRE